MERTLLWWESTHRFQGNMCWKSSKHNDFGSGRPLQSLIPPSTAVLVYLSPSLYRGTTHREYHCNPYSKVKGTDINRPTKHDRMTPMDVIVDPVHERVCVLTVRMMKSRKTATLHTDREGANPERGVIGSFIEPPCKHWKCHRGTEREGEWMIINHVQCNVCHSTMNKHDDEPTERQSLKENYTIIGLLC